MSEPSDVEDRPSEPQDPDLATVVGLLDDACARTILETTARQPRSAGDLADQTDVSRQTVYRRLDRLRSAGFVNEHTRPRSDGNHETVYKATFDRLRIRLTDDGFAFDLDIDSTEPDAADELTDLWRDFRK